ncbi:sugar transporter domain-containing protein [Ditylenchus destructor]|uniref:Sugar transporter domain-containing protein n=1 Tax=Ditylenchus destructor TaxID=166010 RepID=A0AAD4QXV9_9BILA|nr:sugar transporter domain-containing protein [Ditylenchus destructor]
MAADLISGIELRTTPTATPASPSSNNWRFFRLLCTGVMVAMGGSFHFGYQMSIINPMADVLQSFIENGLTHNNGYHTSEWMRHLIWGSVAGLAFLGALLGAIAIPFMMDRIGARCSFVVCSVVSV